MFDCRGNFTVYGYPEDIFPPTDFHTATLVGDSIFIIGSLGYSAERKFGTTPVRVLNLKTLEIETVITEGTCPGWIFKHDAKLDENAKYIEVSNGDVQVDKSNFIKNKASYRFELDSRQWTTVGDQSKCDFAGG